MWFERWLHVMRLRWLALVRRDCAEQDLEDEIHDHLERQIAALAKEESDPAEARRRVLRHFGGVEQSKERCRDARGVTGLESLVQDVRYGTRMLRRHPVYATIAVLTLALGIGANTAVFSLIDGILLARLPYASPDDLVSVTGTYPNGAFVDMRDQLTTLDVAAYADGHWFTLKAGDEPVRVAGTRVSAELMSVLGVRPAIGRWLEPAEDLAGQDQFVILSHALWLARFGRNERIVGRFIDLDGIRRQVIAVMPPSFQFPSSRTQLWVPLGTDPRDAVRYWAGDFMPVIARLRAGVTQRQARAEVALFQSRIPARFPWPMPADWNRQVTVVPLKQALVGAVRSQLLILLGAVALVLVIACANVANLSLSKAVAREREIGVRAAIGAGPGRIARQLVTESLLLASLGALVGLLFAVQGLALLKLVLPPDTPRLHEVGLSWRVLTYTGAVAVLTGCGFGLAPVVQALRARLWTTLGSAGRDGVRAIAGHIRSGLAVAQISCAVLLVIAAALLVRSLWLLSKGDPGFRPDAVLTARISPGESACGNPSRCLTFYRELEARVRGSAGVDRAALINTLPLTGAVAKRSVEIQGFTVPTSQTSPLFWLNVITPDYFSVMGIRLQAGRFFTPADLSGTQVAIVSASTAHRFWPGTEPLGGQVRFVGELDWRTVVGVVADVRAYDLTRSIPEWIDGTVYVPFGPSATLEDGRIPSELTMVVRTNGGREETEALVRQIVRRSSSDVVVDEVRPMRSVLAETTAAPAATASLLASLAGVALALGCLGVYGVLAFLVTTQRRDLGIRIALGAQPRDIFRLVMLEGAKLCAIGVVVGIAGAMGTARWLSSELHGVSPTDPAIYGAVAVTVTFVTLMACYVPTRRAMAVDPLVALREP